jgi:hypothetical protein
MRYVSTLGVVALALALSGGGAFAQRGPVAMACKTDIPKYCAGLKHGRGEVRKCLESHYEEVSTACKHALDTTGGGRGMNR